MLLPHDHFVAVEQAIRVAAEVILTNRSPHLSAIPQSTLTALLARDSPLVSPSESAALQGSNACTSKWRGMSFASPPAILAAIFSRWAHSLSFPVSFNTEIYPFSTNDTAPVDKDRLSDLSPQVSRVVSECCSVPAKHISLCSPSAAAMVELLCSGLGPSGIARCFGCRQTPGTALGEIPPLRHQLEAATRKPINSVGEASALTVGGRALEKHLGRRGIGWEICYWGCENEIGGSVSAKNVRAESRIQAVLDDAEWLNIVALPGGQVSVEIRVAEGFGARWNLEDGSFRGFVEPYCPK